MNKTNAEKHRVCQICGSDQLSTLHPGVLVRPAVAELIQGKVGRWSEEGWICSEDLQKFRHEYVQALLEAEKGELTTLEKEVLESLRQQEILSRNPEEELQSALTKGQRLADRIATAGGSWRFITSFAIVLFLWIGTNTIVLVSRPKARSSLISPMGKIGRDSGNPDGANRRSAKPPVDTFMMPNERISPTNNHEVSVPVLSERTS